MMNDNNDNDNDNTDTVIIINTYYRYYHRYIQCYASFRAQCYYTSRRPLLYIQFYLLVLDIQCYASFRAQDKLCWVREQESQTSGRGE